MITFDPEKLLDATSLEILSALQEDARLSFSELGRRVGLSSPAVAERVHRLEEAGIITGYHAQVDTEKLGYALTAFIRIRTTSETCPIVSAWSANCRKCWNAIALPAKIALSCAWSSHRWRTWRR